MIPDSVIATIHLVLLLGIFGLVASYRPDEETRYRPAISLFAAGLAGSSLALATQIATQWGESCQAPQLWQVIFTAFVFVAVARTRGNVAKLFPRLKWTTHT